MLCSICNKNQRAHLRTICKDCYNNKRRGKYKNSDKKRYQRLTLPYYLVYMLPNENFYVGKTNSTYRRKIRGKAQGMDYSEIWELHRCDSDKEALRYEKIYHKLGFPGKKMA